MIKVKEIIADGLILFAVSAVLVGGVEVAKKSVERDKNDADLTFEWISSIKVKPQDRVAELQTELDKLQDATKPDQAKIADLNAKIRKEVAQNLEKKLDGIKDSNNKVRSVNLNEVDPYGRTVLMWACYANYSVPTDDAVKDGIYQSKQVKRCEQVMLPVVDWLIGKGVPVAAQDGDGWTALTWASWSDYPKVVDALIKSGADINHQDHMGNTALMMAAQRGNINVVRVLVKNGADLTLARKDGQTAMDLASDGVSARENGFFNFNRQIRHGNGVSKLELGAVPVSCWRWAMVVNYLLGDRELDNKSPLGYLQPAEVPAPAVAPAEAGAPAKS